MNRFWKFVKAYSIKMMQQNIEYRIFPFHFFLLTLSGLWYPQSASSSIRFFFKILLNIVVSMQTIGSIEMSMGFFNSFELFALFCFCVAASGCYKSIRLFQKRKIIISILDKYSYEKMMKSQDDKEEVIDEKFKNNIRFEQI